MNWSGNLKNKIKLNEPLGLYTTFKIGGPSNFWFEPENLDEFIQIYSFIQKEKIPLFLLGGGSNVLIKDEGWLGITIRLSKSYFKKISLEDNLVTVGTGQSLAQLIKFALDHSLGGSEFLAGIPGTIGGAIMMNAGIRDISDGKRFVSIGDIVDEISVLDKMGRVKTLKRKNIDFGYRHSDLNEYIIIEAKLKLNKASKEKIEDSINKFWEYKKNTQDFEYPSAGCVFKNPQGSLKSSGQLIEEAGFKGKKIGEAQVSLKHANFIINTGQAKAEDVLALMKNIQEKIEEDYNLWLEPEIEVIG
jgi:UDP-N-acetylmuramate dehydrogenase